MRKLVAAAIAALAVTAAVALPATATKRSPAHSARPTRIALTAQITRFRATAAGVVADGTLTGVLRSGKNVSRKSAPVTFAVLAKANRSQCNVLTLKLAPVFLELLGLQVQTSTINLHLFAVRGAVLGNLFCALAGAKVSFPHVARDLNSRLHNRPLRVLSTSDSMGARAAQAQAASCQVVKLVLGPLHLDLLGLVVDLYGQTTTSPVVVTISAVPSEGLLGQLLCGLTGGTGVNTIAGLQNLLTSLGLTLSTSQVQGLLSQLGISNLSSGLTQSDLNRILDALGLGTKLPTG